MVYIVAIVADNRDMKRFAKNAQDFCSSLDELLSKPSCNERPDVVFRDFKFSLVDCSSEEMTEVLGCGLNLGKNRKVILVQQKDTLKYVNKDESSVTDESLDWTFDENARRNSQNYQNGSSLDTAVSVDDARYLLSLYNVCCNPNLSFGSPSRAETVTKCDNLPDIIVLCSGKDNEHIALMGCSSSLHRERSSGEDKGQKLPGVLVTTVSCNGPITTKTSLLTVDQIIQHIGCQLHRDSVSTSAFAQYEIVGASYHEMSVLESTNPVQYTTVTMDCSWEHVKGILERPHSAKCTVHICATPGDMRSAAYSLFKELATLVGFARGLQTEELEWNARESSGESVKEAVARLIEKEKLGPQRNPEPQVQTPLENEDTDFDSVLRGYAIPERQDLYFSETLWSILWSKAACYDDVVQAFSAVVRELQRGELQPIVHTDNQSTLAKVIRASYQQQTHMVNVDRVTRLTMLVEIGLDKLRRDYTNFFIASELTTLNQLEWYLQSSESCSLLEQVSRLQALHNVLEVAVVSVTSLKLPPEHRRALVRSALSHYQSHPHDDMHTFSHPVEGTAVQRFYSSYQPSLWRLTVRGGPDSISIYQLSTKVPLSHITLLDADMSVADVNCGMSFCYYVTHVKARKAPFL